MRYVHCFIFLMVFVLRPVEAVVAAEKVAGDTRGKVMLVLDASGSMWGQISGKAKIQIAREVIRDLLADWDETLDLGLIAYGHRRKGDCGDIQILIPVGKADPKRVIRTVNGLNPKGKTPLSEAVRQAAQHLKYKEEQAIVILVSDGEETCNANPCETAKALEAAGVDFTTHVVAFNVTKEKQAGLRCLAENTGGSFVAAKDADTLLTALVGALEKTKAITGPNLRFKAVLKEGAKPLRRETVLWVISWDILKANEDAKGKRVLAAQAGDAQVGFELPPGRYVADLKWDMVRRTYPFEVKEDERAEHVVDLNAGVALFTAVLAEGGPPVKGQPSWTFYEMKNGNGRGKKLAYKMGNQRTIVVPGGGNMVVVKIGDAEKTYTFTVKPGVRAEHTVVLDAGIAEFTAVDGGGAPVKGYRTWTVYQAYSGGKKKQASFKSDNRPRFILPAGRYRMQLGYKKQKFATEFEVKAGETRKFTVAVQGR